MRILTVQHQEEAPPGLIGRWLTDRGARLEVVRPDLGMPLPDSLRDYAGLLVLGGVMGAYDDEVAPWLPRVRDLLGTAVRDAVPTLGVCLGHQLLAAATGGTVGRHPDGRRMGTVRLRLAPQASADPLFGALRFPYRAVRWHQDVVRTAPPQARVLATGDGDIHGIRVGSRAWGVQAHPEASASIVGAWAQRTEQGILDASDAEDAAGDDHEAADRMVRVADVRAALADVVARERELSAVWQPFAEAFTEQVANNEQADDPRRSVGS